MPRALVLSYYFPPLGGAGVQRTTKLLKHLPAFGWEAAVVTGPEDDEVPWAPHDPTLAEDVPSGTPVVRIEARPPKTTAARARWRRLTASAGAFDRWWQREAFDTARALLDGVDLVYASMSPFSTGTVADALARQAGVPWVADLRDPWALDDWASYPSRLHRGIERRRMGDVLRRADAVVMNTEEARTAVIRAVPRIEVGKVSAIPNGWDRDDFAPAPPERQDDAFRIVLSGYSHTSRRDGSPVGRALKRLLGGSTPGIDPGARSHATLVEAIQDVVASDPDLGARLELHVAGAGPNAGPDPGAGARVVHHGYLPHRDAVALLRSADLLFLPMHGLPDGMRATTVAGKTYEYLAARRPILAALPEGDARDLLAGLPEVWTCRPGDVKCLADGLRAMVTRGGNRKVAPAPFLERFERKAIAEQLVSVFADALARRQSTRATSRR